MLNYLVPFFVYVAAPSIASLFWKDPLLGYAARLFLTLPLLVFFLREYKEIRINWDWVGPLAGIAIFFLWVGLDPFYPKFYAKPEGLSPYPFYYQTIAIKFVGMVVLAPVMEELFFRSFLPRYLQARTEWSTIPAGTFTPASFIISALLFGLLHVEWLPAVLMGFGMNWLFQKTKNLWPCILAHAVANFILWEETLRTHNWNLW